MIIYCGSVLRVLFLILLLGSLVIAVLALFAHHWQTAAGSALAVVAASLLLRWDAQQRSRQDKGE